jgi:hemerythrin-like domain-containing protein
MEAPDLTLFGVIHRAMRDDAARLADAVERIGEGERVARAAALSRWYTGYLAELHEHHTIEDSIFYPDLVERVPATASMIQRIDADHAQLDDLLQRTTVALERLANPHTTFRLAHGEAVGVTRALSDLIDAHLGFEDTDLVPLFGVHYTAAEYRALEGQATKNPKLGLMLFTIPWVMAAATPDEQKRMLAEVPFFFRAVWWASRGRYRRMDAAAFGNRVGSPARAA